MCFELLATSLRLNSMKVGITQSHSSLDENPAFVQLYRILVVIEYMP